MSKLEVTLLKNGLSTEHAVQALSHLKGVVCLSGSWGQSSASLRYDIISAAPSHQLSERSRQLDITTKEQKTQLDDTTSFEWLEKHLANNRTNTLTVTPSGYQHLPIMIGFIGYISYDYGKLLETLPETALDDTNLPDLCGGIYHWNLINDKQTQASYLVFADSCPEPVKASVLTALEKPYQPSTRFALDAGFKQDVPLALYQDAFARISHYIAAGDCYQINYAHRHQARYSGDPANAYSVLNNKTNTPYSAYLDFNNYHILSLSPERFIKVDGNMVETKPIKGTQPRGLDPAGDAKQIDILQNSIKDRAENLMIVDLLRNDLNRACVPGSVAVPDLFKIETYPNVHHLVSTVIGEKPDSISALDVFKRAFPGGSITGAPKIRAMEIIEELEPTRRSIYCGSIFYAGFDGRFDSNICIRTLLCKDNHIYCWGGGGIVADSNCEDEYQESITKIKNLMTALEKISGVEAKN